MNSKPFALMCEQLIEEIARKQPWDADSIREASALRDAYKEHSSTEKRGRMIQEFNIIVARIYPSNKKNLFEV